MSDRKVKLAVVCPKCGGFGFRTDRPLPIVLDGWLAEDVLGQGIRCLCQAGKLFGAIQDRYREPAPENWEI